MMNFYKIHYYRRQIDKTSYTPGWHVSYVCNLTSLFCHVHTYGCVQLKSKHKIKSKHSYSMNLGIYLSTSVIKRQKSFTSIGSSGLHHSWL